MRNVSVARRYARALLAVAAEGGAADRLLPALEVLGNAVEHVPELMDVFVNPAYSRAQRAAVVEALLAQINSGDPVLLSLVRLLNDRDRLSELPAIARQYRDIADEREGRVRGKVVSATPLSADALKRLESTLEGTSARKVILETKVDPKVLGGISAQVGSVLYDGTLRSQLEQLRRQLKRA